MALWKMLVGTVTLVLVLCGLFEILGVITLAVSAIAYQKDPQTFYIITGAIGFLVAMLADVD